MYTQNEPMTTPKNILVCDDEPHIRQIVAQKLTGAGFTVREARNGSEGLEAVKRDGFAPDLIISDFQMPVLSGLEMCQALKLLPQTASTPALMLTARGYILSDEELAKTNIRQVIPKPFGVKMLLDRVTSILGSDASGQNGASRAAA